MCVPIRAAVRSPQVGAVDTSTDVGGPTQLPSALILRRQYPQRASTGRLPDASL